MRDLPYTHVEILTDFAADIDLTTTLPSGKKFPEGARAIFVKVTGTVIAVTFASGDDVTFAHTTSEVTLEPSPARYIAILLATDATELWVAF